MPICDSQQTRFWDPITGFSPFSMSLSCLGAGGSWCPGIIWTDATPKCCGPNSNMMLCPGGTCQDSGGDSSAYSCPPVMLSSEAPAPILTPVPTVTEVSAFLTSAAPSFVSPSLAPAPQSTTARTCPGGLLCGNDTFCSIDNKNCCPQFEGQTYCPGAGICFRPSVGDQCCSDKICYSPQICAPGGSSCVNTALSSGLATVARASSTADSTSELSSVLGQATSSAIAGILIVPTITASNNVDAAALSVLQTAVPQSAQSDRAGACFLNTAFSSYTTPSWYVAMTAPAQSYFASVNAQNTAACKAISTPVSSGLSDGAKAGIGVGIPVALAVIGGIVYLLIKAGIIGGATAASTSAPAWSGVVGAGGAGGASAAGNTAPAWSGVTGTGGGGSSAPAWSGVTGGESSWNGVAGPAHAPPPAHPMSNIPPVLIAGALRRSSSSERVNTTYHQSSPVHLPTPGYQCQPPLRSVSPPESYQNRQQPVRHASELSADGASSPRTELSATSAYYGHEMYSAQRHEAPTRDEEHPRELPAYRHY